MRHAALLLAFALIATSAQPQAPAASQTKPVAPRNADGSRSPGGIVTIGPRPWLMTDDERIERRAAMSTPPGGGARAQSVGEERFSERLDGLQHPELFLPFELYDYLLNGLGTNPRLRSNAHTLYDPKLKALGYDVEGFWQQLATVAKPYLAAREGKHGSFAPADFTTATGKRLAAPVRRDLCTARFASLQASRRAIGGTQFDRLLYVVVAPTISENTGGTWSLADHVEQLRYMAGGCQ
jgi:hypothetical protein